MKSLRGRKLIKKEPYLNDQEHVSTMSTNNQPCINDAYQMGSNSNYIIRKQTSYCYATSLTISPYNQQQQHQHHQLAHMSGDSGGVIMNNTHNNNDKSSGAYDTSLTQNFFDPNDIFQLNTAKSNNNFTANSLSKSPQTVLDMESGVIQPHYVTALDIGGMTTRYDSCDDAASLSSSSIFDDGCYSVQPWEQDYTYEQTPPPCTDFGLNYYTAAPTYEPEFATTYCSEYQSQFNDNMYEFS